MKKIHIRTKESEVIYTRKTINAAIRMQATCCGLSCTDRDISYKQGKNITVAELKWFNDHGFEVCRECFRYL